MKEEATIAKDTGTPSEVVLDFSGVKPFEPMDPKEVYLLQVQKLEFGRSKPTADAPKGNPKASCELVILAPEEVQVEEWEFDGEGNAVRAIGPLEKDGSPVLTKAKGRILFREFSLQPQALPFLHEFIKAVDPGTKLDEAFRFNPSEYLGRTLSAKIVNEGYEEQVRSRVKRMSIASKYQE